MQKSLGETGFMALFQVFKGKKNLNVNYVSSLSKAKNGGMQTSSTETVPSRMAMGRKCRASRSCPFTRHGRRQSCESDLVLMDTSVPEG